MLLHNLARKARALGWERPEEALADGYVRPVRVQPRDRKLIYYKGFVVQAWTGQYELKLPPGYLELAYDAGLGGKNSQGFGMVEVMR
jgi:CRISPR-associated endoribonuclease Cas6